jgi:putative membrane protein
MALSADESQAIEAAFDAAQTRTRAPIACVLAAASSDYEFMPMLWGGLLTLVMPWPLLVFTRLSGERIFIIQLVVCLASIAAMSLTRLRVLLTPRRVRRVNAHRAALVQFSLRGLDHAPENNGVLLYVSLAERYARVIADPGACRGVSAAQWQSLIDTIVADLAAKGTATALTNAAARCADLLAAEFPPDPAAPPGSGHRFHSI